MPNITIDGKEYQIGDGQNLLSACLSLDIDLPYFCWHPAMGSVGACRQCALIEYRDKDDRQGKLVMGCMTQVKDGGIYGVEAETAREFRGGIIEDLMTNHPHDCPVCEEGGECHLQDMTEMSGHTQRRYRGLKRTHKNQYLGPFINHEMNRCITCYRCVRFYRDYAGGTDLEALGRNSQIYFGRPREGLLENGFSGNLVEVCPTGVFTDKTFSQHFVRKWDLQTAPSVCEHCAVGCNTAPGARQPGNGGDTLRRVVNLFNRDINGYFLCDRGRFGYDYVNSAGRIKGALCARQSELIGSTAASGDKLHREIDPARALQQFAAALDAAGESQRRLVGIGSPRSSLENNFALRQLVSPDNFYSGLAAPDLHLLHLVDTIQRDPRVFSPSTPEIEEADAVLILGEDLDNTAPRISLAVRQAARNVQRREAEALGIPLWQDAAVRQLSEPLTPVIFAGSYAPACVDLVAETLLGTPEQTARFAFMVAELVLEREPEADGAGPEQIALARRTAQILKTAAHPLIVSGCSSRDEGILKGAGTLAAALGEVRRSPCATYLVCPEVNSLGIAQMFAPQKGSLEQLVLDGDAGTLPTTLVVLENDLTRRADPQLLDRLFAQADQVILLDSLFNATARCADLIFPAAATAESQGTYINSNGQAQRFYTVYEGVGFIQESWRWLADAAALCRTGGDSSPVFPDWQHAPQVTDALVVAFPQFVSLADLGPDENFRIEGMKTARQSHRYSGRTAIHAEAEVAEMPPHRDPDAPLSFSMEGIHNANRSPLQASIWAPGWNSNQSLYKFQEGVGGPRKSAPPDIRLQRAAEPIPPWSWQGDGPPIDSHAERLVPLYRLYGSGELSNSATSIASILPPPFALISVRDAARLKVDDGGRLRLSVGREILKVDARISGEQPEGILAVSCGLPHSQAFSAALPVEGQVEALVAEDTTHSGDVR
ncbi:NADH-quinone oxidoreductase subunit NuoG [Microbulbifer discodermiae]|uniref:NADH-quinone oxidoreductase subunit NuoG n=1 Tax=Microbulbifer sp. 2201CG32-9 TaxID=3232309 RepID=UPI00345B6E5C